MRPLWRSPTAAPGSRSPPSWPPPVPPPSAPNSRTCSPPSGTEAALRISYFEGDETYIQTLFREAYYASPDTALDLPEAQVYIYPQGEESGRQRIVEVLLTYHLEQKELQRRRTALARRANEIVVSIWGTEGDEAIQTVSAAVLDAGHYDPEGGPALMTPWWRGQQTARDFPWPPCCWPNGWS